MLFCIVELVLMNRRQIPPLNFKRKDCGSIAMQMVTMSLLAITRIVYARFGKKIMPVLLWGMMGAVVCYLVAGFSTSVFPAFIACVLTGVFTSMLWPGSLIMMEEKMPSLGVAAYALMAAGGDLGASFAPQLMGIVVDKVKESAFAMEMSSKWGVGVEQVGLKVGMLVCAILPIIGIVVVLMATRFFKEKKAE